VCELRPPFDLEGGKKRHHDNDNDDDDSVGGDDSMIPRSTRTSYMSSFDIRRTVGGGPCFSKALGTLVCVSSSLSTNSFRKNNADGVVEAKDCNAESIIGGGRCAGVGEECNNVRRSGGLSGEGEPSLK